MEIFFHNFLIDCISGTVRWFPTAAIFRGGLEKLTLRLRMNQRLSAE
jgi:hypothetical protein